MIFSSLLFILIFLPLSLTAYYLTPKNINFQNSVLVILSIVFYSFGDIRFIIPMIVISAFNYVMGLLIYRYHGVNITCIRIFQKLLYINSRKLLCSLVILINLSILFFHKYIPFDFNITGSNSSLIRYLPLGISFFTFQNISYIIDVYQHKTSPESNILNYLLYIMFFPQLIAGPIVKYTDVNLMLNKRTADITSVCSGLQKFSKGLFKKVALATTLSFISDEMFSASLSTLPSNYAWLGAIAYTFQIYYDFSGYSDMAIGLGKMFGIYYPDNFDHPYMADSISDFFRRWHITLSDFFRDYVYIPLGGNRHGNMHTVINTMVVFILTGMWHGAGLTYLLWGTLNGIIISIEKVITSNQRKLAGLIHSPQKNMYYVNCTKHILTFLIIVTGWVIFRSESVSRAIMYLTAMYTNPINMQYATFHYRFINIKYASVFLISVLAAGPYQEAILMLQHACRAIFESSQKDSINDYTYKKIANNNLTDNKFLIASHTFITVFLYTISVILLINGTYTPFIYFKF